MRIANRRTLALLPLGAWLLLPATVGAWAGASDPGDPFTMSAGRPDCRSGQTLVTLRNQTRQLARFDLKADSASVATGSIPARKSVTRKIHVGRGHSMEIEAFSVTAGHPDTLIDSTRVRNTCPGHQSRHLPRTGRHLPRTGRHLPRTGPPTDLLAKLATAGGLLLTGAVFWWYSSIWPRGSF
ncbi:hypothetical protein [Nonomuraea aurantiaca]|uniref:hypothetical protein n=1 Tax=Nonomuraea aurantiaca TaxID=2878562 RepID=UPI001CD95E27|nr:hypothetical protein [Nonomuraea aurantiaca]MCA2221284.1 hypothetical protein [Nonomuraea aurantiaca]